MTHTAVYSFPFFFVACSLSLSVRWTMFTFWNFSLDHTFGWLKWKNHARLAQKCWNASCDHPCSQISSVCRNPSNTCVCGSIVLPWVISPALVVRDENSSVVFYFMVWNSSSFHVLVIVFSYFSPLLPSIFECLALILGSICKYHSVVLIIFYTGAWLGLSAIVTFGVISDGQFLSWISQDEYSFT